MAGADRNRAIGLSEERLGKGHHIVRFAVAQISGIEVTQSHAVEAVGVFQKRCQPPVGMRAHEFPRQAMMDDGRTDCGVVALHHTSLGEEVTHLGERLEPCHRIAAMSMAHAVVRPGDIVQIDGRPQT